MPVGDRNIRLLHRCWLIPFSTLHGLRKSRLETHRHACKLFHASPSTDVQHWVSDSRTDMSKLVKFSKINKIFSQWNMGIPSSMPVQGLLSSVKDLIYSLSSGGSSWMPSSRNNSSQVTMSSASKFPIAKGWSTKKMMKEIEVYTTIAGVGLEHVPF